MSGIHPSKSSAGNVPAGQGFCWVEYPFSTSGSSSSLYKAFRWGTGSIQLHPGNAGASQVRIRIVIRMDGHAHCGRKEAKELIVRDKAVSERAGTEFFTAISRSLPSTGARHFFAGLPFYSMKNYLKTGSVSNSHLLTLTGELPLYQNQYIKRFPCF